MLSQIKQTLRLAIFSILLIGTLFLVQLSPAHAQEQGNSPNAFTYVEVQENLAGRSLTQLKQYEADPTAVEIRIVEMNPEILRQATGINLNLPDGQNIPLDSTRIEERTPRDYSLFGSSADPSNSTILVIQDNDIVGTVRTADKVYSIRPLDNGQHALIWVDEPAFPVDYPAEETPEFKQIQRQFDQIRRQYQEEEKEEEEIDLLPFSQQNDGDIIDAIVAYTPAARVAAGNIDASIQLAIDQTNESYKNSNINSRLRLVHKYETNYAQSDSMLLDLARFVIKFDGIMDEVHDLRNDYGADIAMLIIGNKPNIEGFGGFPATQYPVAPLAFAVLNQNLVTNMYAFGHEIGHIQGCAHNPEEPTGINPFFSYGYGLRCLSDGFRTIMAYPTDDGTFPPVIPFWSNPDITTCSDVAPGEETQYNNARVINKTARKVANFRHRVNVGGTSFDRYPRAIGDVNGDGRADVVAFGNVGVFVFFSTESGFSDPQFLVGNYGRKAGGWTSFDRYPRTMGDVDDDGKADIIGFGESGVYVSFSTGEDFTESKFFPIGYGSESGGWSSFNRYPRTVGDVDGDGKADIIGFGKSGVYVSFSTGTEFTEEQFFDIGYSYRRPRRGRWTSFDKFPRTVGDVNGDGKADIIGFGNDAVFVSFSTGKDFTSAKRFPLGYSPKLGGWTSFDRYPRTVGDVDGDGKADIIGFGNNGVRVSFSTGEEFTEPEVLLDDHYGPDAGGWTSFDRYPRTVRDVDGDGKADIIGFGYNGISVSFSTGKDFTEPQLLARN